VTPAIRAVPLAEAEALTKALWDELVDRYGDGEEGPAHPEQFLPPYGVFLVASVDGQDVACGGLRLHSGGVGEVKRMYVAPGHRGRGLARAVLEALVQHARAVGLAEVWLETGTAQPEAMALYESSGFAPMEPYGDFAEDERSRCYRLRLA
jgi:GNAT superfamily N-acetyltransferase